MGECRCWIHPPFRALSGAADRLCGDQVHGGERRAANANDGTLLENNEVTATAGGGGALNDSLLFSCSGYITFPASDNIHQHGIAHDRLAIVELRGAPVPVQEVRPDVVHCNRLRQFLPEHILVTSDPE
jgi:hypothetical protein